MEKSNKVRLGIENADVLFEGKFNGIKGGEVV